MHPSALARALCLLIFFCPAVAQATERVRIGVLAFLGAEHSLEDWSPTIRTIRTALGQTSVEVIPLDHAGIADALDRRSLDFVMTNPGHYVELEVEKGISRILTLQASEPVASTFIVRAGNHRLGSLKDLRGKALAIVGKEAFGGFQVGWREMLLAGVNPEDAVTLKPVGFPMTKVFEAVLSGEADVGIVRACLLERQIAAGTIHHDALKVLEEKARSSGDCALSSPVYPDWPLAKARDTDPELAKKVATALLALQPPEGQASWTVPLDYQPVHDLFRDLKIGPYEYLRHEKLTEFLWRMRHWIVGSIIALLAWLVHVARVELLVRRRTAELAAAHTVLVEEMTARRAAEERDALHMRELDHAGRLSIVGEMASGLAHEINQPLAAIVNYADGCAIRLQTGHANPEGLLQATRHIQRQAERAGRIVQQMRSFARKREPEFRSCDVNDLVNETLNLFEGMVRRAGAELAIDLATGLPTVLADKIQIQQVLLNLFQNALDAMQDSVGIKRLSLTVMKQGGGVAVIVGDTGSGISEAARKRMFEPFFTTKPRGLGLGLALCQSIMESHGGRLDAEMPPAGGTRMVLWLPEANQHP